jgi:DMATS type aromatic prenyltransferase
VSNFEAVDTKLTAIDSEYLSNNFERGVVTGFELEKLVPARTYAAAGIDRLTKLARAMGMESKTDEIVEIFRTMTSSWCEREIGSLTDWQSDVSDDRSPFEFSIALAPDKLELRILIEAQGEDPHLQSNWQAGLNLNHYLAERFNISLDRFRQIEDLFAPTNSDAKFAIWHSACFYPDKDPAFKIYLNPQSQSPSRAAATIEESLVRLGFPHAWSKLSEIAAQRGPDRDEFIYFSLDLAADDKARVKVYLRHHHATAADLESALSLAKNYTPGDATEFCQTMTSSQGAFTSKPIVSCFSWTTESKDRPSNGTIYIPAGRYTDNDLEVKNSLTEYLCQKHLPVDVYNTVIQNFAMRSLSEKSGMHSHLSLQRKDREHRVAIYLNPELSAVSLDRPEGRISSWIKVRSLSETALYYEINSIADCPFLQRLQREPANLTNLWLLFANGRTGIVEHFTRRLASVVGRIDCEYIRCILTKQLNEELGNGDISKVHRQLFNTLISALEPYKPQIFSDRMLVPGSILSQELEKLYTDSNPYIGVGAAIVMEICGKQIDEVMGREFLTRTNIDRSSLSWLHLHEELEIGHADEAQELARSIERMNGDVDATKQGAEQTALALSKFFEGMYRICFD